jgi:metallo-beta-lactamase family protein
MAIRLSFLGAAGCVTGACFLLETAAARILVDCGMFQGSKTLKALNYEPFPFDANAIDVVLLTHAHVDHSGLLPKLALAGFTGPILATPGTIELCRVMLPDAGAIQEMEVETLNRRQRRRGGRDLKPIFTSADAEDTMALFQRVGLKAWIDVAPGIKARFWNAGHILGAASIEVEVVDGANTERILFSGDIGPSGRDFAMDPEGPDTIDHVVVESTYGDVERTLTPTPEARRGALAAEMRAAHAAGGPLLIPAFAVERTQELIVDLLEIMERGEGPRGPIFLDSPLGIRASEVFLAHGRFGNGEHPFASLRASPWLRYTESVNESRAIERMRGWHVIVASSGMCDAGRIRHHLKRLLWRDEATVLLTGFQAVGTLGRLLEEGRKAVRIQGEDLHVAARIRTIDVYSGHADANGLQAWIKARNPSGAVFFVHGEPNNRAGLKRRLHGSGFDLARLIEPNLDACYLLQAGKVSAENLATPRLAAGASARLDWHNDRSEFLARLNASLESAADDSAREALLRTLSSALPAIARNQGGPS